MRVAAGRPGDVRLGILGGGQLGRMMALAATLAPSRRRPPQHDAGASGSETRHALSFRSAGQVGGRAQANLGITVHVLDGPGAPAAVAAHHTVGSFSDAGDVRTFVESHNLDTLTVEIEHVNVDALEAVARDGAVSVHPAPRTLRIIQDKFAQKQHLEAAGVAVAPFVDVPNEAEAECAGQAFGYPFMLKSKRLAYDGRGNALVTSVGELAAAAASLGGYGHGLYAERLEAFAMELSIMVARSTSGEVATYPLTMTEHRNSILHATVTPADVPADLEARARRVALAAVDALGGAGMFGIEMFAMPDGRVLLNEVAPRPHNAGHYTMNAAATSQFEQTIRAVLGLPLGSTALRARAAGMLNILGVPGELAEAEAAAGGALERAYRTRDASVHWYGKECRVGRKLGHVNLIAPSHEELWERFRAASGSRETGHALRERPGALSDGGDGGGAPPVAIIMGSDSDLPTMAPAADMLRQLGVDAAVTVVSAHRTPRRMVAFAASAHERGVKVIIAGAGGAAHLPGMVAAMTPLPVIGVPVRPAGAHLDGLDALLSIVQMPRGVPVATVSIGNAANAGLLAARILGADNPELQRRVRAFADAQEASVLAKAERLEAHGWSAYLDQM